MGAGTALALGAGAMSIMNTRSRAGAEVSAAKMNAGLVEQQAAINANLAGMTAGAQAAAIRSRSVYEAQVHEMNADIMASNAVIAEQDAQSARERTQYEVDQIDLRNRRISGGMRAAYGASGVTMEGTPADVAFDSALAGEIDELAAIYIGDQEVRRSLVEAYNYRLSEKQQLFNADQVRYFGNREASVADWQGRASSAATVAMGNMKAANLRSSIPIIRQQGRVNMFSTALTTAASVYSFMGNTPNVPTAPRSPSGTTLPGRTMIPGTRNPAVRVA